MSGLSTETSGRDTGITWIRSSYSGPTGGNCVEVAFFAEGEVAMRNSRHPDRPTLVFTKSEREAFLGARDGEFAPPG